MNDKLKKTCITAMFTAIICAIAPITVPTGFGVPITLQTAAIAVAAFLLGVRTGTAATVCYLILGAAGLPVFSGFQGGVGVFVSPTGGFLFAFPLFSLLLSLAVYVNRAIFKIILCFSSILLLYCAGIVQYTVVTKNDLKVAIGVFLLYFIKDLAIVFGAYFLCARIRPVIQKLMQSK